MIVPVIPGRESVLIKLHEGHPGASRIKSLARSLVWWSGMDRAIENMVKQCVDCQQSQPQWRSQGRAWPGTCRPIRSVARLILITSHVLH